MEKCAVAAALLLAVAAVGASSAAEPVVGEPCEGCELVFEGMPETLTSEARIAPADEPGEPLTIEGVVTHRDGRPADGIVVYAYHTDASGIYPSGATRHGRLRGWALTDRDGRYRFETIRPAAYPGRRTPQHVHMHVIEPGHATYWIDSLVFSDDPLLREAERRDAREGRGGSGLVEPVEDGSGGWTVRRDIVLGLGVPGYDG